MTSVFMSTPNVRFEVHTDHVTEWLAERNYGADEAYRHNMDRERLIEASLKRLLGALHAKTLRCPTCQSPCSAR